MSRWITGSARRLVCAGIALALIPVGVAWRMAPLHLPFFLYKYGGSVLWAAMVYFLVAAVLPRLHPAGAAGVAAAVAAAVEFSRLYHSPPLDAFRSTSAGKLLLGRYFSIWNMVAYAVAIALAAGLDAWRLRGHPGSGTKHRFPAPSV